METVDEEFLDASLEFIEKAHKDEQAVLRLVRTRRACTSSRI